jgi:hypothetical protein
VEREQPGEGHVERVPAKIGPPDESALEPREDAVQPPDDGPAAV